VCAGGIVVGFGWLGSRLGGAVLDRAIPAPAPAEHDPAVVREEVRGPEPQFRRRDLPRSRWGGLEQVAGAPPPSPEPVRDGVGPEPGYRPVDIPDRTWDLVEAMDAAGEEAAPCVALRAGASS
jgi:hypothetical protein